MLSGLFFFLIALAVYSYIIYPIFLNKLNRQKIPGPLHLKLSSFFILNIFRKEQGIEYLENLHKKYGPIVQIAPNELSFNDIDSMKKIYLYGNFPKEYTTPKSKKIVTGFYSQFGNFNERNLFSTGDTKLHLAKKKPLQKLYSKTFVMQQQSFIQGKINNVVEVLLKNKGTPVDVYALFCSLAMDVVSGFEYGFANSSDFINELKYTSESLQINETVFHSFRTSSSLWFYTTMFPSLYNFIVNFYQLDQKLLIGKQWIWNKLLKSVDSLDHLQGDTSDTSSILETLYKNYEKHLAKIGSEIADHVLAGHETTGITLSYITWQLSRPSNQHWQDKLFAEIKAQKDIIGLDLPTKDSTKLQVNYNELDQNCPILHAIVQEACRLHAAIPGSERRYVPYGKPLKYQSFVVPQGTMVSCQPFSLHREVRVFGEDVEDFKPERWLRMENELDSEYQARIKEMEKHIMTFGQGNRMCLGMHLALIEIKACVASIYGNPMLKDSRISKEWCANVLANDKSAKIGYTGISVRNKFDNQSVFKELSDVDKMRMADSYTTRPLFDECWMTF
ncbi:hypothetical protein ACO0QE_002555 [Hanseniaspora vineae]